MGSARPANHGRVTPAAARPGLHNLRGSQRRSCQHVSLVCMAPPPPQCPTLLWPCYSIQQCGAGEVPDGACHRAGQDAQRDVQKTWEGSTPERIE